MAGTVGSACTMAMFWASVRLRDPRLKAMVAPPPLSLIGSRQVRSLIVDSRAAEPPTRTTTGSLGGVAFRLASTWRTRAQSAAAAALAAGAAPPELDPVATMVAGTPPVVACAEQAPRRATTTSRQPVHASAAATRGRAADFVNQWCERMPKVPSRFKKTVALGSRHGHRRGCSLAGQQQAVRRGGHRS